MFDLTADGKGEPYVHGTAKERNTIGPPFELLSKRAMEHYEKKKENGGNVYIDRLSYEEFMLLGENGLSDRFRLMDEKEQKDRLNEQQGNELEYAEEDPETDGVTDQTGQEEGPGQSTGGGMKTIGADKKPDWEDSLMNRMLHWEYSKEQKEELYRAVEEGLPKEEILSFFYPDMPPEAMAEYRESEKSSNGKNP